jgi:hypothetical protein
MVQIAITQAVFDAIAATLPVGDVGYENATNDKGKRLIWLPQDVLARLSRPRGPGENYSEVILRMAAGASVP